MKLNAAGQAEARKRADNLLKYSTTADEARQAAYASAMHALDGRDQREQRITDLAQEFVDREARDFYRTKGVLVL